MKNQNKKKIILSILLFYTFIRNLSIITKCEIRELDSIVYLPFSLIDIFSVFGILIILLATTYIIWSKSKYNNTINEINIVICLFIFVWQCFFGLGDIVSSNPTNYGYDPLSAIILLIINIYQQNTKSLKGK